jgi:hypothetical protein
MYWEVVSGFSLVEQMSMSLAGKLLSLADKFAAIASKYPVS